MATVVNSDNLIEFVTTGKVADFKPPEAPAATTEPAQAQEGNKEGAEQKPVDGDKGLQDRNADGTFKAAADTASEKSDDRSTESGEIDDAALPEIVRRKIGKKHRQMMEAQEFARERDAAAEIAEKRAAAAERELQRVRGKKSDGPDSTTAEAGDPAEPKPEDFKTVGDYTRALTKYEVAKAAAQAASESQTRTQQQQQQAQAAETARQFAERQSAFIKLTPDYEEVVENANFDVPQLVTQYCVESEMGPQLAYHISKNPSEAERLSKLSPSRMLAEMGKLEMKLAPTAAPAAPAAPSKVPQVSKAPAPTEALNGDSARVVTKDPSQMSFAELREHRRAEQMAAAAAGRRH